jgi:NifU-like N terminal domain/Aminotransferase class-V
LGGVHLNGADAPRGPAILNVSFEGVEGESLVTGLSGLAVSTGSACNSASGDPSYVLRALGRDSQLAQSSLRFSVGRFSTQADIDFAARAVRREVTRLRALSPASEAAAPDVSTDPATALLPTAASGGPDGPSPERVLTLTGEAGGPRQETWVRFHLSVADGIVKAARFKAYGCPHTLAVADCLTRRLPGRARSEGLPGTPAEWAVELQVPVEKLGRLLVIEDAMRACFSRWPDHCA